MKIGQTAWIGIVVALAAAAAFWLWGGVLDSGRRTVEGPARVPHAGVLMVEDVWIPLLGLHPPREDPNCVVEGIISQCPLISTARLAELVMGKTIRCELQRFPGDDRNWGSCGEVDPATGALVDGPDSINRRLIRSGWAVADDHYTPVYLPLTEQAQEDRIGVYFDIYWESWARTGTLGAVNETNDAGTLEVRETRVRLFGIDAPELTQECSMNGIPYPCGLLASAYINTLLIGRTIICHVEQLADGRYWGRCGDSTVRGNDFIPGSRTVNEQMVLAGWAMANRGQTDDYAAAEDDARLEKRGMWAGEFVRPADWRNGER